MISRQMASDSYESGLVVQKMASGTELHKNQNTLRCEEKRRRKRKRTRSNKKRKQQ